MKYEQICIAFGLIVAIQCQSVKETFHSIIKKQCPILDASRIGIIFLYLPQRNVQGLPYQSNPSDGLTFKINHYFSLLALSKLFKPNASNRILFYYINESGKPKNNHYNQWLNDSYWNSKLPIEVFNFIKLDHESVDNNFNLLDIFNQIKSDSPRLFDIAKDKYLLITSDVIIGPKIFSCFVEDLTHDSTDILSTEYIKSRTHKECYEAMNRNKNNYYSFLYKLDYIHNLNDFSGIFLWNNRFKEKMSQNLVDFNNFYKCTYRNDVIKDTKHDYSDSFCIFGFELNVYESPLFQDMFSDKNNYFKSLVRKHLFGKPDPITYEMSNQALIPNIVHLIWFSPNSFRTMKFIEYLCLKSILNVLKPDKIRIHGDHEPVNCRYWKELSKNSKIEWVYREKPLYRYNQNFSQSPIQHLADVARLEVLYEEGGIYSDFDILWVKPLDKFRYMNVDLIASNDLTSYCYEFPFNIQIGAFMAPKKSEFLRLWLNGYKEKYHLFPGDYVAVSMCEPYKLYEKYPHKVFIDNRLQMIFFNGWSAFIPRYIDVEQEKLKEFNENLDWLNDGTHGYHLPRHGDLNTEMDFKKANRSLPIRIAEYIFNL
ncbi:hypothetical protein BpHYR1_013646 [Brachionus plicatilis]|uniref:Uncharacterized protein n=1 Tax=Brachionus plicatilis TaxID=10195 RepID=A0A3M7SXV8_BRAPC|nr:hypothetical protein BpHYR1_013646 [Brachionus plicatilis]